MGAQGGQEPWFYAKKWFDAVAPVQQYNKNESIKLVSDTGNTTFEFKSFYVRSPYRYTPTLRVASIQNKGDPLQDGQRPGASVALDQRLQHNYERLLGRLVNEFWNGKKTGDAVRTELLDKLNNRLTKVLDITVTELGDVTQGRGQLYFSKGQSKNFPFEALSAGEKEVIDLLIDLEVKTPIFNDTVYAIDEPELHLNTAIQRKFLDELVDMVPDSCQLWVATHSMGFLRAVQEDLSTKAQVLDFSQADYFSGTKTIVPITWTRANWKRIFNTALEDLTGLLAPQNIVYCEGYPQPSASGEEQGLDAIVYNATFEQAHNDTLFISSGGGTEPKKYSELALTVLSKAFDSVKLILLKDRDALTDKERDAFLAASSSNRMLKRREIENHLFDFAVLAQYAANMGVMLSKPAYHALVSDIASQDLKLGQTLQQLKQLCTYSGTVAAFKKELRSFINGTPVYQELHDCIFPI